MALLCALALCASAAGCLVSGRRFEPDSVPKIKPGRTTEAQVRGMFGVPLSVRSEAGGRSVWKYDYSEKVTHDTGVFTRIGSFVMRMLGGRSIPTPVNVAYSNETRHQLAVFFGDNGVVDDYAYERSEKPTRRIY